MKTTESTVTLLIWLLNPEFGGGSSVDMYLVKRLTSVLVKTIENPTQKLIVFTQNYLPCTWASPELNYEIEQATVLYNS